jgi:hypothetical protein
VNKGTVCARIERTDCVEDQCDLTGRIAQEISRDPEDKVECTAGILVGPPGLGGKPKQQIVLPNG